MPGGYLYGWEPDSAEWVKVVCNPDGELDIDATAIFENPPTEDEAAKGPSSEWAFDHKADVAAHHAKYTDVESRAAINNIIGSDGKLTDEWHLGYKSLRQLTYWRMTFSPTDTYQITIIKPNTEKDLKVYTLILAGGYADTDILLYQTDHYVKVIHAESFQTNLALYLEEAPTNGVVNKAPTSNWAFDHNADVDAHHAKYTDAEAIAAAAVYEEIPTDGETGKAPTSNWAFDHDADVDAHHARYTNAEAIAAAAVYEEAPTDGETGKAPTSNWAFDHDADVDAHHAKYTDAEAIAACGLDGNLYHTISGTEFRPHNPSTVNHIYTINGIFKTYDNTVTAYCPVMLPDGATVTAVKVDGNAGASSKVWTLYKVVSSDRTKVVMATAAVQTEDTTITSGTIYNETYSHFIAVASLMANDEIYYARIKYTL